MTYLSERYAKVLEHKGIDICTLKSAVPADGDKLGYVIDNEQFKGKVYNLLDEAIKDIDNMLT